MVQKQESKPVEVKKDNWQGRAQGMRCETCMWFYAKNDKIGRCRKHAPSEKGWPPIFKTDCCGDHRIDENKI